MNLKQQLESLGCRVAVLCGGRSNEREVSLVSGRSVAQALADREVPHDLFELSENALPDKLDPRVHLVLPVIHGTYGEDGGLSADLDRGGFVYAGCDASSSVLCFDKLSSKGIAARVGLTVAPERWLQAGQSVDFEDLASDLAPPLILKPRRDGSSVGLHLVSDAAGLAAAEPDLNRTDYLAEPFYPGYDLTVGIVDGRALGVVGVHSEGGLYDYQHKYTSGLSRYEVPARIGEELAERLRDWSETIFRACGCRDLALVDYRLSPDGGVIFLEINTLPGMTPTSLLPKSAQCTGLSFEDLVLKWVQLSLNRYRDRL